MNVLMFGEKVRAYRLSLSMTQEELAGVSNISVRTIRQIEAGRVVSPRPSTVRTLADALRLMGVEREAFYQTGLLSATIAKQAVTDPVMIPAQLPLDVPAFTGRGVELTALDVLLRRAEQENAVMISLISGLPGVGKTALAVRWAHRVRGQFPDGQLYINLRGFDPDQPVAASDALARFLGDLGVAETQVPLRLDDRAARYRTEIADRRMLIVLDNAASAEQVRPLLPGVASCAVVITSRDSMAGMIAVDGACRIDLDLLAAADAMDLLHRLIGSRVAAEPESAAALSTLCARLPLALRVAAELAVARCTTPLADLANELANRQRRLELLDAGGDPRAAVESVFSWSIQHLPPAAVRVFSAQGLHPGPDSDIYAVAALAGSDLTEEVGPAMHLLARAHLVHPTGPNRWSMHDLIRLYAHDLAMSRPVDARAAVGRLLDYYLATSSAAMDSLHPGDTHRRPRIHTVVTLAPVLTDPDQAREWLDAERSTLIAVVAYAATHDWPAHAVRLATTLFRYLAGNHPTEALAVHAHARCAAQKAGDLAGEASALIALGVAYRRLGHLELAVEHHRQALDLHRRAADRSGQARALESLGLAEQREGKFRLAADHLEQALALFRAENEQVGQADALVTLGEIEDCLGRDKAAIDRYNEALSLYQQANDRFGQADVLNNLGFIEARLGRVESAVARGQQALNIFRLIGDRIGQARTLETIGMIHLFCDQLDQAAEYLQQALSLFQDLGDRNYEGVVLNSLGEVAESAGHHANAVEYHTAALAIAVDTNDSEQQARAHRGIGHAHHARGARNLARKHYLRALAIYTQLGTPIDDKVRAHLASTKPPAGRR